MSVEEIIKMGDQKFAVSHRNGESDFKSDGLRGYAAYRDLGFVEATNGLVQAHVIKLIGPCTDEVRKRHVHDVAFQMVYILSGSMDIEIEGVGKVVVKGGGSLIVPAKAAHTVLDYEDGTEVIEINMPANFATVPV